MVIQEEYTDDLVTLCVKERNLDPMQSMDFLSSYDRNPRQINQNCVSNISSIAPAETLAEGTKELSFESDEFNIEGDTDERVPFQQIHHNSDKKHQEDEEYSLEDSDAIPDETYIGKMRTGLLFSHGDDRINQENDYDQDIDFMYNTLQHQQARPMVEDTSSKDFHAVIHRVPNSPLMRKKFNMHWFNGISKNLKTWAKPKKYATLKPKSSWHKIKAKMNQTQMSNYFDLFLDLYVKPPKAEGSHLKATKVSARNWDVEETTRSMWPRKQL